MFVLSPFFPWIARKLHKPGAHVEVVPEPLREFVYLDEVSLGSLLASQKGEITENITSQIMDQQVGEIGAKISSSGPMLPAAEVNSRYQTTNSTSLQTMRKATAQSLFRELHKIPNLRKVAPIEISEAAGSFDELFSDRFSNVVYNVEDLIRGDLVEFRVKLSASWIFQISSMIAEFSDMFDESPMLFAGNINFFELYKAKDANKIISKLLAGLIPVNGIISDFVLLQYEGENL